MIPFKISSGFGGVPTVISELHSTVLYSAGFDMS